MPEDLDGEPLVGAARLDALLRGDAERSVPLPYAALRRAARDHLGDAAFDYVAGGAGDEHTVSGNRAAFDDWQIRPRMLRDVSEVDPRVDLAGTDCPFPVWLAPIGAQTIVHEGGEVATARACADLGAPLVVSSVSSKSLEAVADAAGDAPRWFQLYPSADAAVTESFVDRAAAAGYEAIVVTVDTPSYAWRERDLANGFHPQMTGHTPANYFTDPAFRAGLDDAPEDDPEAAYERFHDLFADPGLDWQAVETIADLTDLPVLIKGILRSDDARRALEHGADGFIVSNHGGRQVDRSVASLDALPEVREAVGPDVPVLLDGGVRSGADAVVALALGADAVCIGRPYVYGLAVAGADGVRDVVADLLTSLHSSLAQSGHASPATVDRGDVTRDPHSG
jgi:lactate 2-monooxygenase